MVLIGENHHSAKLTEADVRKVRKMRKDGYTVTEIAKLYSVSCTAMHRAINRITWRHVK